jgi:hypothetical protein
VLPLLVGKGFLKRLMSLAVGGTSSSSYRQTFEPLTLFENSPSPANSEETNEWNGRCL